MIFRRNFIIILFAICLTVINWFNFMPSATALGGKLPAINQPAPEFTLPTNVGNGEISF